MNSRRYIYSYSILFLAVLLTNCSNKFDGKNGIKTIKFPNSEVVCQTIEYKDGMRNGVLKEFFENGKLKTVQHYKDNKNVDTAFYYHVNGKLAVIQMHDNGDKVGCWKKYNTKGELYSEMCFEKDRLNGSVYTYSYKSLHLIEKFNFKDGLKEGKQEVFYNSGKPKSLTYFHDDQPCLGTQEWSEAGEVINNDFSINVSEKNKVNLENKLYFYITLQNPQSDDEVWKVVEKDTGNVITQYQRLEKKGDSFYVEFTVYEGGFIMEKVKLAAYRKTRLGNTFIKTTSFNASANNY